MARKDKKRPPADAGDPRDRRITPADIQAKEFRESFRGYNEHEVDEFLDLVTEEFARLTAETKRLQEQLDFRQTLPLGAEAEEVLRRARDEAERIVAEARSRASVMGGSAAGMTAMGAFPALPPEAVDMIDRYLGRERDFLRSLASTVQAHMEAVKADTKAAREMATGAPGAEESTSTPFPADLPEALPAEPEAMSGDEPSVDEPSTGEVETDDGDESPAESEGTGSGGVFEAAGSWGTDQESADEAGRLDADGPPTMQWGGASNADPSGSVEFERGGSSNEPAAPRSSVGVRTGAADELQPASPPEDDAGEDRSLKELFWGED
jgi:DivIVA domain-containing protein